jgi:hypothetical protein
MGTVVGCKIIGTGTMCLMQFVSDEEANNAGMVQQTQLSFLLSVLSAVKLNGTMIGGGVVKVEKLVPLVPQVDEHQPAQGVKVGEVPGVPPEMLAQMTPQQVFHTRLAVFPNPATHNKCTYVYVCMPSK